MLATCSILGEAALAIRYLKQQCLLKRTKKGHAHVRPYMSVTNSVGVVRVGVGVGIIMKLSIEHDE